MEHIVCSIPTKDGIATVTSNVNIYDIEERLGLVEGKQVSLIEAQKELNAIVEIETDLKTYDTVRGVLACPTALSKKKAVSVVAEKGRYKFVVTALDLENLASVAREKMSARYTEKVSSQSQVYNDSCRVSKTEFCHNSNLLNRFLKPFPKY